MSKLTLTRNDVRAVAHALMVLNGETTTLDVKEALRKKGFWATQDQVREFMLDVTQKDGDVAYRDDNGQYRVYYLVNAPVATVTVVAGPVPLIAHTLPAVTPLAPAKVNPDNVPSNYEVCDTSGGDRRLYVNVTRGQAKHLWAVQTGRDYQFARTTKQL